MMMMMMMMTRMMMTMTTMTMTTTTMMSDFVKKINKFFTLYEILIRTPTTSFRVLESKGKV